MFIGLCLAVFLITCFLTYLIRRYALAKSLIDIPNARSSHSVPTPRGGGLSVVMVWLLPLLLLEIASAFNRLGLSRNEDSNTSWFLEDDGIVGLAVILLSLLMVAGIGFWDDHKHIPARWRLLVHFGASALALLSLDVLKLPGICFFGFLIDNHWLLGTLYLFGLVWLLNLYNFMDGIDGIASVEAITVALSVTALSLMRNDYLISYFFMLFSSSIAGFLVWNFPHAKIFMGDACSGFLGFILGILAIITSATGTVNIWSWLILLGVFTTDATFTLIKRLLNKEVWYEAHASHAYQHYARQLIHKFQQQGYEHRDARTKSHRRVNLMLILINVFWLLPLATAATFYPFWAALIAAVAFAPLIVIAHRLKAGTRQ
jgi:Fuc2NAc and GlcNAc transferase